MSELTKEVRLWSDAAMGQHDKNVLQLCDEHERLEAENEKLRGECAMALAERDAFCSLTTQATRELDRLEAENEKLRGVLSELLEAYVEENGGDMPTNDSHPAHAAREALGPC